jgi:Colicin-E5 Imm protein
MNFPRDMLYKNAADFFLAEGSVWMRLSPAAAIDVCMIAAANGIIVARIEGGIWHSPGFEMRLDCIWDGADPPISESDAHLNNLAAADFIREEMDFHTAFIFTAPSISGWPHKMRGTGK